MQCCLQSGIDADVTLFHLITYLQIHLAFFKFIVQTLHARMQFLEKVLVKLGHGLGLPSRYKLLKKIGAVCDGVSLKWALP